MAVTGDSSMTRRSGALSPGELAQASVIAALSAATAIIAVVVPFAAGLSLLGTVPMGLLAYRYRLRVLLTATVAGAIIAFLIAGLGGFMTVVNCAYIGGLTGIVKRRGRGTMTVFLSSLVAGAIFGVVVVTALAILVRLRHLDLRIGDRQRQRRRRDHRAHPQHGRPGRSTQARLRHRAGLLAVAVLRVLGVVHRDSHPHRLVGVVAGDVATADHSRCAQARVLGRHRNDRTRSDAPARRPLPLSQRRSRRAGAGVAERRTGRAPRDHRCQRLGQDDVDVDAGRTRTHCRHHRTARCRRARPARRRRR